MLKGLIFDMDGTITLTEPLHHKAFSAIFKKYGVDFTYEEEIAKYNRIYFVLQGKLTLTFNNKKVDLNEGDCCYLTKGEKYIMSGTFKVIVINQPAFGT